MVFNFSFLKTLNCLYFFLVTREHVERTWFWGRCVSLARRGKYDNNGVIADFYIFRSEDFNFLYLLLFIFFCAFLFYFFKLTLPLFLLSSKYRVALALIKYPNCQKTFFMWNLSRYYKKFVCIQLEIARQPLLYKICGNNAFYSLILSSNRQYSFSYF